METEEQVEDDQSGDFELVSVSDGQALVYMWLIVRNACRPRLKDSDVTWLYGPLHTAVEPVPPPKVATAEERLGLNRADSATSHRHGDLQPTKPILKHRTLSEMLSIPNPSSPILEAVRAEEVDDHDLDESRPILLHTKSDTNIVTKGHHQRRKSPPRGPISSGNRTPVSGPSSSGSRTPTGEGGAAVGGAGAGLGGNAPLSPPLQQQPSKKHISFNTFVEQCIAVDDPDDIAGIEGHARDEAGLDDRHDDGEDLDDDDEDDDDEDAMLEMKSVSSANSSSARSNRSNSTRSSRPSLSRHGSQASSQPDHMTIAKIAPTTLKTLGDFPSPSPQLAYAPTGDYAEPRSPAASAAADEQDQTDQVVAFKNQAAGGYPVAIDQGGRDSSVSPNSVGSPTWDDEDDYAVGFDYFSGPDLGVGDEYDTAKRGPAATAAAAAAAAGSGTNPTRTVQSHVGNAGHYGKAGSGSAATAAQQPPVVGQVPAQPKWRSGSASSSGATTPSGSGNTSGAGSPASTAKPSPGSQSPTSPDFANISSPPQPGRSILKIRPPGSQQAYYEPETSPTNSHFNWKPSAATGQGGLESGVRRVIKEPVAGSLPSYDVNDSYFVQSGGGGAGNETPPLQSAIASAVPVAPTSPGVIGRESGGGGESRGRSAVRTGANIAERSASRSATGASGGSTAATTSISPSSSRTAVQVPISAAKSSSLAANKSESSSNSSSTPKSPPLANETPSAPQVQRPVGLGGVMPKDDVDMKREQRAKEQEERSEGVDDRTAEYVPDRGSTPTPHSSPQVSYPRAHQTVFSDLCF